MENKNTVLKATMDLVVKALENVLTEALALVDDGSLNLRTQEVVWINDNLDYIAVKYWEKTPDGDRQEEYACEEPKTISAIEAIDLLTDRINNSLRGEY